MLPSQICRPALPCPNNGFRRVEKFEGVRCKLEPSPVVETALPALLNCRYNFELLTRPLPQATSKRKKAADAGRSRDSKLVGDELVQGMTCLCPT